MIDLRPNFTRLSLLDEGGLLVKPTWVDQIRAKQLYDKSLVSRFRQIENGGTFNFGLNSNEILCFKGWVCVPNDVELRQSILREAHSNPYAMHPGGNKMCRDLQDLYCWPSLKWKKVKVEHQLPSDSPLDFVSGLPLTSSKKDSVWVIVDQLTKFAYFFPIRTDYSL
ncbi:integrase [Gossypium australe]|uniref:Integrase n=1 Tax=Gossypium australe TaxID=47621 RepID=A0A5B6UW15_9ROSI|nr:integrase [Gossypium australe]